jgi:cell division protein FtsL
MGSPGSRKENVAGMSEFYTVKQIDNSRLVRIVAPNHLRECARVVSLGAMIALCAFLYAWQHFETIQLRYELESLKSERAQTGELNQELKLEIAGLRAPGRIDAIARRQLGLTAPVPGQVAPMDSLPPNAVMADARPVDVPTARQ